MKNEIRDAELISCLLDRNVKIVIFVIMVKYFKNFNNATSFERLANGENFENLKLF